MLPYAVWPRQGWCWGHLDCMADSTGVYCTYVATRRARDYRTELARAWIHRDSSTKFTWKKYLFQSIFFLIFIAKNEFALLSKQHIIQLVWEYYTHINYMSLMNIIEQVPNCLAALSYLTQGSSMQYDWLCQTYHVAIFDVSMVTRTIRNNLWRHSNFQIRWLLVARGIRRHPLVLC